VSAQAHYRGIVTPALVERAQRVLHPWSGATADERMTARAILREAHRRALNARFARLVSDDEL
jgi:hypothetical protein